MISLSITDLGLNVITNDLGVKPYNYQYPIIEAVLDRLKKRTTIRAATRSGKSYIVACSVIAYASIFSNSKVGIIAPSKDKTKIIMTYILEALSSSTTLEPVIDLDMMGLTKMERLKREVSKQRVTFKNGSSIEIKTADVKGKGFSLMGAGYDLCIPYNELIKTDKGDIPIGVIIENQLKVNILSFNHKKGIFEYKPIKYYMFNGVKSTIKVKTDKGEINCTPEHPVYIKYKGYVPAKDIKEGDEVLWLKE